MSDHERSKFQHWSSRTVRCTMSISCNPELTWLFWKMKILRLKNSVLEVHSLKIPLVDWPLQIHAQSVFFTDKQAGRQTHKWIYTIYCSMGTGQKGPGSHSVEGWVCFIASFDPLERWKKSTHLPTPQGIESYCLHTLAINFIPLEKRITNTLTELFVAATNFPSLIQLFSDQRTYIVIPSGFFSILIARSAWNNNTANSMAFKLTYELNLRLVNIQNKRWRTCVFVPFKIVFPLPVEWRFIVLAGQRRIRISVS